MDVPPNSMAQAIEFVSASETALLLALLIKSKDGLDQMFPRSDCYAGFVQHRSPLRIPLQLGEGMSTTRPQRPVHCPDGRSTAFISVAGKARMPWASW